jgi:oligopeptide transport system permease protein
MFKFFLRRILWLIPVLIVVGGLTFVIMRSAPGGPWDTSEERRQVDESTQAALDEYYGMNKPMWRQFTAYMFFDWDKQGKFICGIMCGNMGPSYRQRGRTVQDILFSAPEGRNFFYSRFGYSIRLGVLSLLFAIIIGIPAGILSALNQNTIIDYISLFFVTIGISIPNFVMAIFLIIVLAAELKLMPIIPRDWDMANVWIMPVIVLGFGTMARTARLTRASMLEVMRMDYIRTARAKGLAERVVIIRHMIKNAFIPVITILGPALAGLVTGSLIIETMFSFPGAGRAFVSAIFQRDYSMIMGTALLYALLIAVANLSVDLTYVLLDPRIRLD